MTNVKNPAQKIDCVSIRLVGESYIRWFVAFAMISLDKDKRRLLSFRE